jgi:hypothetical protein
MLGAGSSRRFLTEERFEVRFADAVNSPEFDPLQPFGFDVLEYGQGVDLQEGSDLFGGVKAVSHGLFMFNLI